MEISIEYCGTCNYRPQAAALASVIEEALGVRPILVHSNIIGMYKITVDGDTIFSTYTASRFPEKSEIVAMLKKRLGGG